MPIPKSILKKGLLNQFAAPDQTWVYKGFHGIFHTFFPVGRGALMTKKFLGGPTVRAAFFSGDNYIHWYWNEGDMTAMRQNFFKNLKRDKNYLRKLQAQWAVKIKNFERVYRMIDRQDMKRLSDTALADSYARFYDAYLEEFCCFMALGDSISMPAESYLVPEFKQALGAGFAADFPKIMTTKYLSFIEEENIARAKLLKKFKAAKNISHQALAEHARQFFYITNNYARGLRLTSEDFRKMISQEAGKKSVDYQALAAHRVKEKNQTLKKYKLSAWQKTLLYIMDEFFKIQDTRKKYVLISNFYQFEFLREAARRLSQPFDLVKQSVFPEFSRLLAGKLPLKTLKERVKISACLNTDKGYEIMIGPAAEKLFAHFQKPDSGGEEIKGLAASLGKARGRVKKILKIHDLVNMERGNIMVSSMTRPEMMPAMRLAAAIVTDEGGITSHAAIISRELGIPCLIGCKIASRTLNDGDEVEVDADKGIVRLLKKKL